MFNTTAVTEQLWQDIGDRAVMSRLMKGQPWKTTVTAGKDSRDEAGPPEDRFKLESWIRTHIGMVWLYTYQPQDYGT